MTARMHGALPNYESWGQKWGARMAARRQFAAEDYLPPEDEVVQSQADLLGHHPSEEPEDDQRPLRRQ